MSEAFKDDQPVQDDNSFERLERKLQTIDADDMSDAEITTRLAIHLDPNDVSRYESITERKHFILHSVLIGLDIMPDIGSMIDPDSGYTIVGGKRKALLHAKEIQDDIDIAEQILEDKEDLLDRRDFIDFRQDIMDTVQAHASGTNLYRAFDQLKAHLPDIGGLRMKGLVQAHILSFVLLYKNIKDKQFGEQAGL
ncbi:MAG: hypothetical protein ABJA64_02130 [Candidatus Saccharibacteria bacterium]